MLRIDEAKKAIFDHIKPPTPEMASVYDAFGRILIEDAVADCDIPLSDNSAMDGYAVIAADVQSASPDAPVILEALETIPAGKAPENTVAPGKASRIMTGAAMPTGADAVVMVEDTCTETEDRVFIFNAVKSGRNVRRAGEDVAAGTVVLHKGRRLTAADLGMLSATGHESIMIARRPAVGIISTGDEIIPPNSVPTPGQVRNSNSYSLLGQCAEAGATPLLYGIIPDSRREIKEALITAAKECDIVLTSGGVSAGDFDEVREIIRELGEIVFWKVRMKPGKPLVFGIISGMPVFGLPGNPVSVMVCFEIFVRPCILKMMGAAEIERPRLQAVLENDLSERQSDRHLILRGVASFASGGYRIRTTGPQGSGILSSMVKANSLFMVPAGGEMPRAGDTVEFFFI